MRKSASALGIAGLVASACATPGAPNPPATPETTLEVPRLGAARPSTEAPEGVRFRREPARVGQHFLSTVTARSSWMDPQQGLETTVYESEYDVEVLAVDGAAASRVRITFGKNFTYEMQQPAATPVHGKSYLVSASAPFVLDAATNAPPSAEESTRVTDVLPDLGVRAQVDQVLPDGAMNLGEHRDGIASAITRILHPRVWTLDHGTAVLRSADAEAAVFDVSIEATSSASRMRIAVKGSARVRLRDARLDGFDLRGTFTRSNGEVGELDIARTVTDL